MAFSKIILDNETLMDVTQDTVDASSLLSPKTATKNDGTGVTGSIATKTSTDLTVSGQTVTAPAGYYASNASKAVSTMTLPTSASGTSSGTNKSTIGRSTADQYINIPTGYNTTAANYKISAVANGSATAPSTISGTGATVSTGTNTLTLSKTVSVTPTVSAGYISTGTAGNASVSLTATVTTKGATTYGLSTSDATIASGTYLTGAQTIKGITGGTYTATSNSSGIDIKNYSSLTVAVPSDLNLQDNKTVTPTVAGLTVTPDTGYNGLAQVTVSGITTMTLPSSTSGTSSGTSKATLTPSTSIQYLNIPTGYNSSAQYYTISGITTMTLPTAASGTSSGTNKATIGRSTADRYINIPTGYNTAAANYKISAVANGSATTPATSLSITPTISISSGGLITASGSSSKSVTPTVSAGYISAGTAGTVSSSASNTYQMTVQGATTYGLSTEDTEIASGTYLTGKQTIKGVTGGKYTATSNQTGINILNYSTLDVQVPSDLNLQSNKNATPSISQIIVTPDTGYNGLAQVTIAGITTMTLPTGTTTTSSGTNKATIGRSTSTRYINIPTGYNTAASYYTISAVANGSATTPATTIAPTISAVKITEASQAINGQISITASGSSNITPSVSAGYVSSGTSGTITVSNSTIIDPSALESNLIASNIKSGVSIFNKVGTYKALPEIGTIVCMNTNTNPSTYYGGTWTLIDKEFSSVLDYTTSTNFSKGTAITSVTSPTFSRSGHTVSLKITFVNTSAMSGTNTTVGTWSWSNIGISSIGYAQEFIGLAEGYGILLMDIASGTGVMRVIDVIARTGSVSGSTSTNSPIAAGVTCYAEVTFTVDKSRMLDAACDKFYFQRTA